MLGSGTYKFTKQPVIPPVGPLYVGRCKNKEASHYIFCSKHRSLHTPTQTDVDLVEDIGDMVILKLQEAEQK